MDILYVGTLPPHPGGSAMVGEQIVAGLAALGHRVRALSAITAEADPVFERAHPAVPVIRYRVPHFVVHSNRIEPHYLVEERRQIEIALEPLLAGDPPDVVIVGRENLAPPVVPICVAAGVPTLMIAHSEAGGGAFNGWLTGDALADSLATFQRVDLIVVVAPHLAQNYLDLGCRVACIDNGVDTDLFRPGPRNPELAARLGIAPTEVVVAHVSNLKELKCPLDVIESAAVVLSAEPSIRYLIVGEGQFRAAMEARAAELGIAHRVTFTGWIEHGEVPEYFRVADIVLMPSSTEALALVYLETLASGRVLIASDITSSRHVISDDVDGLLHPVGDVPALAALTLRAAREPALRERLGIAARRRSEAFALTGVVRQYDAALRQLVAAEPQPQDQR
jgi:glycosyltransferase involved in cell wall biosynthesis